MKVRELIHYLKEMVGLRSLSGSHLQLVHKNKQGKVTIPIHGGDIPKGTLNSILKQAGPK